MRGMSEPTPPAPDLPELPELPELQTGDPLIGYDWLRLACHVLSTLSLMLIAIALLVRL